LLDRIIVTQLLVNKATDADRQKARPTLPNLQRVAQDGPTPDELRAT
jgi:hypothetical protein